MMLSDIFLNTKCSRQLLRSKDAVLFLSIQKHLQHFLGQIIQPFSLFWLWLLLLLLLLFVKLHFKLRNAFLCVLQIRLHRLNFRLLRLCLVVNGRELTAKVGLAELPSTLSSLSKRDSAISERSMAFQ